MEIKLTAFVFGNLEQKLRQENPLSTRIKIKSK